VFDWHNETTLKSFGRLSKEPPEQGEKTPAHPPITPLRGAGGEAPGEEDEAAMVIRPLDA
jgi:hypothetical protein